MSIWFTQLAHFFKILAILFTSILLSACDENKVEETASLVRPVRTATITLNPIIERRTYPAIVQPSQQANLSFKVSGRIIELPIRAAMEVKEGEVIAQLDKSNFKLAVKRLESQLEQATSQLSTLTSGARREDLAALRAKLQAAQAQFNAQRAQVNRLNQLVKKGAIARVELDKENAKLSADKANVNIAKQELIKAKVGARTEDVKAQEAVISDIKAQLSKAKADLADTTLRSPFDGVIASRSIDNFANIQANSTIAVLQKLNTIDLQFDIPGDDVAKIGRKNNHVTKARLDPLPNQIYDAKLVEFSTQADAATQTFRGRVSIPYPDDVAILPGMTGSVIVIVTHEKKQLTVPESALAAEPDGSPFVWLVNPANNSVSKRKVVTNGFIENNISIKSGLTAGEVVVTAGVSFLHENMIVKPIISATE